MIQMKTRKCRERFSSLPLLTTANEEKHPTFQQQAEFNIKHQRFNIKHNVHDAISFCFALIAMHRQFDNDAKLEKLQSPCCSHFEILTVHHMSCHYVKQQEP